METSHPRLLTRTQTKITRRGAWCPSTPSYPPPSDPPNLSPCSSRPCTQNFPASGSSPPTPRYRCEQRNAAGFLHPAVRGILRHVPLLSLQVRAPPHAHAPLLALHIHRGDIRTQTKMTRPGACCPSTPPYPRPSALLLTPCLLRPSPPSEISSQ